MAAQIVNSYDDVTRPTYNPGNSQLTALLTRLREERSREAYQNSTLEEQKRQANSIDAFRNKELEARKASEDRYFNAQTGQNTEAKAEAATRAQFGYRGLQQDLKSLESDFYNATSHANRLMKQLVASGVPPEQVAALMTGEAKAPAALEQTVKNLQAAARAADKAMAEANQVTSAFNREYGIGVVLGVDRKGGRFSVTQPYVPGQSGQVGGMPGAPGSAGGAGLPGRGSAIGAGQGQFATSGEDESFFSTNSPPKAAKVREGPPPPPPQMYGPPGAVMAGLKATGRMISRGVGSITYPWSTAALAEPSTATPAAIPIAGAYSRPNYTDVYLNQMGVPRDFSATRAAQPITDQEAAAYRAAHATAGQRPYYFGPPAPAMPWEGVEPQPYPFEPAYDAGYPPGYFNQ